MTLYYSATAGGFYDNQIHKILPEDAVEISAQTHQALLNANAQGKIIQPDKNRYPIAVDPPPPTPEEWAGIHLGRCRALMSEAALKIAPLQDAVDLNIATEDEKQCLKVWKLYRVKLNRIEQQPSFPAQVKWPKVPEAA
jgi:hypothetical protein